MNMKKLFLLNLPYLLFVYPFDKLAQAFRLAPGSDLSGKLLSIGDGFTAALSSPWLSFHPTDLLIGIAGAVVLRMAVYLKGKNAKKYRHGIEYGSARWGTAADIAPYMDKDFFQNIPMTQTERITMASRPKQPKYARNKNILVIGGSGSGKTRFFCKPSLLQAHSSYVCTDPKGTLLPEIGAFLERKKYRIKCLNLINFRKSMKYNPLAYIRSEKDILKLVNALIMNTKGEGEKSSEDFWVKAERLLYSALIGYIWYEAPEEEQNFSTLLEFINASETREDDEEFKKALADKQVPILVLDEKWHRLFAVHGKPDEIHETENELNALLARQGKLNEELKQLKKVKKQLMESIVANMDGTTSEDMDAQREKKLDEDKRLIDETNQKMEENEDELLEIPRQIRDVNRKLMLQSMGYFYEKIRVNKKESDDIDAWINQVRVDLKKNIIRKQNRDINNREIYAYLHDIFGPSTLDLFDIHYEDEDVEEDSAQNKQNDTKESQKEEES